MTAAAGVAGFRFLTLSPPWKLGVVLGALALLSLYAAWVAARARRAGITAWSGGAPVRR
jgi:hypothetical protein